MKQLDSIGHHFFAIAAEQEAFPAIISEAGSLSYAQMATVADSYADRLAELGVGEGTVVALNTRDAASSICMLLAASLLNASLVAAGKELANSKVLSPDIFIKSHEVQGSSRVSFHTIDASWMPKTVKSPAELLKKYPVTERANAPFLFLHTSGTTGAPKYFALTQKMVVDRSLSLDFEFPAKTIRACLLQKVNSRPFFARVFAALLNRCTIVDSKNTNFWYRAGVNLVSGSVQQAIGNLDGEVLSPKIECLELAGTSLSKEELSYFLKSFNVVENSYGAGETSKSYVHRYVLNRDLDIVPDHHKRLSDIEIVNEDDDPVGSGEAGEVRVRNSYSIDEYMGENGSINNFRNGWFYPGDFGSWGGEGELVIEGRTDHIVNIGGVKVNAQLVEILIESVEGIRAAACFKNPKPSSKFGLLAFATFEPAVHQEFCAEVARKLCVERLGIYAAPEKIRPIDQIPLTAKGEVDRNACERILLKRATERGSV